VVPVDILSFAKIDGQMLIFAPTSLQDIGNN